MDISISGRYGSTSKRGAERMIARGIARRISDTEIEMIEEDHRVQEPTYRAKLSVSPNIGCISQQIKDAFPGFPVLPTIGYDRTSAA